MARAPGILAPPLSLLSVIPADAGIHRFMVTMDPGVRRDDGGAASR
jgi:hypothetical protein